MARESYVVTIIDWRQLLGLLDEEMARSPEMERQVELLWRSPGFPGKKLGEGGFPRVFSEFGAPEAYSAIGTA